MTNISMQNLNMRRTPARFVVPALVDSEQECVSEAHQLPTALTDKKKNVPRLIFNYVASQS